MLKKFFNLLIIFCLCATFAKAQQAEVTIQLNEQFFDALLDALFKNMNPPEFPLAEIQEEEKGRKGEGQTIALSNSFAEKNPKSEIRNSKSACPDSIKLQREISGVKTAVRFREGRVTAPIAFSGNYNPPLIGCVEFSGIAETTVDLEFDTNKQTLIGRARVLNVNLNGAGGLGSSFLARMVQGSIDKKINPIQIIAMEKISFIVPIQNAGSLRMKANNIRHEIANGTLNVRISYEFQKAN